MDDSFSALPGRPIKQWIKAYDAETDRNEIIGVFVGCQINGSGGEPLFNADYSICNSRYDDFDRMKAIKIAYGRAYSARDRRAKQNVRQPEYAWWTGSVNLPEQYAEFCKRCEMYYQDRKPGAKAKNYMESDGYVRTHGKRSSDLIRI